jgi:hypothetical protein
MCLPKLVMRALVASTLFDEPFASIPLGRSLCYRKSTIDLSQMSESYIHTDTAAQESG